MKKPVYAEALIDYEERDSKKVIVFESAVFLPPLEKRFFHFCLRRQPSLVRFIFKYAFFSLLFFFGIIGRQRYLAVRWSFLRSVDPLQKRLEKFFHKNRRKLFFPFEKMTVLSAHPDIVLRELCDLYKAELCANRYITYFSKFRDYKTPFEMYEGDGELYDCPSSPLRKKAKFFFPVIRKKIYKSIASCRVRQIISAIFTVLSLAASSAALGILSLYYGCLHSEHSQEIFLSYFEKPLLPILNILPIFLIMLFVYVLTNRMWIGFSLTSIITIALSWTNFYKLYFRNDPAVVRDLLTLREAGDMTDKYIPFFDWIQYVTVAAVIVLIFVFAFSLRARIKSGRIRLISLAVITAASAVLFVSVYLNGSVYDYTANSCGYLQKNSPTDRYVGRGFLYPGLHSFVDILDLQPENYDENEAEEILDEYIDCSVPADERVNIISVMFEAGCDLSDFDEINFTSDVYAPLHRLEKEAYSGRLVTNIFGGGTINTERAFISGNSLTPLYSKKTDTYAWYLRNLGYTVEGSHPSFNWFYKRNIKNANMGFENYYFSEDTYYDLSHNYASPNSVLFPQIIKFYEEANKASPYFSFSVTYQCHGPYADSDIHGVKYIEQGDMSNESYYEMTNYLYELDSTFKALDSFVEYFRECGEPVVLILFGDHLPGLETAFEELGINMNQDTTEGFLNYYSTPYIIWANDMAKDALDSNFTGEGPDISPCFLMSEFFEIAGWRGDAYMQISSELKKMLPVITENNLYIENGILTDSPSAKAQKLLDRFLCAQYYRKYVY